MLSWKKVKVPGAPDASLQETVQVPAILSKQKRPQNQNKIPSAASPQLRTVPNFQPSGGYEDKESPWGVAKTDSVPYGDLATTSTFPRRPWVLVYWKITSTCSTKSIPLFATTVVPFTQVLSTVFDTTTRGVEKVGALAGTFTQVLAAETSLNASMRPNPKSWLW